MAIDRDTLLRCFRYDAETGKLFWRVRDDVGAGWNERFAGKEAGTDNGTGYLVLRVNRRSMVAHQAIWLMEHGYSPDEIDHRDQDRSNNRLGNLREVTRLENAKNHTLQINNTSGHVGVYWDRSRSLWRAYVYRGKRQRHLGHFSDIEDAVAARKRAASDLGFYENHGRRKAV